MKTCFKCSVCKPLEAFHKLATMKDGHLNKCSACVVKAVAEWRKNNKGCRQREHVRNRSKRGQMTREEYDNKRKVDSVYASKQARQSFHTAKYNATKLQATPSWLTEEDLKEIQYHYNIAAYFTWLSCGFVKHHVDHIVPLQGKEVRGLHVPWNLQVLIAQDNVRKSNKLLEV